jgi:hypothetical protein
MGCFKALADSFAHFVRIQMSEKSRTNGNFIYYLLYMLCMFIPTSTHFLSRFPVFVRIWLNILGSTVAQQSVILCLR